MSIAIARRVKHASLALIALSAVGGLQSAFAVGTDAGTSITNRATVNYSVGGVAQTPIESRPDGNSTPGVGNGVDTTFVVDRRIFMSVADVTPAGTELTTTVPGGTAVIRRFTISNTSNRPIGFRFVPTNLGGDFNVSNFVVRVDSVTQPNASYVVGAYDSSVDTATTAASVPEDHSVTVFVLADIPANATNAQNAIINLQAIAIEPTALNVGTVGSDIAPTTGGDTTGIDTVFGDAGNDGTESDTNVYVVSAATLSVTKTSTVVWDPINESDDPKAIPGARVRYSIEIDNTGAQPAVGVTVADPIPGFTSYVPGSLIVNGSAVPDVGNTVGAPVTSINTNVGDIAQTNGSATVTFEVTINVTP